MIAQPGSAKGGSPRVIFFGRRCALSAYPLAAQLDRGVDVAAVVLSARPVPGRASPPIRRIKRAGAGQVLPMGTGVARPDIDRLTSQARIPLFVVSDLRHPETLTTLGALAPDLLVVSCFAHRLPAELLALASGGGLNLHPSLLPRHRGPDPLFWAYRKGERETGVTVHRITARLDAGEIVAQEPIAIPLGLPGDTLERTCAEVGGQLLADAVRHYQSGELVVRPQDETAATYETWPTAADLAISPDWTVELAYHFVRGVIPLGYEPIVEVDGTRFTVRAAPHAPGTGPGRQTTRLRLSDGVLHVVLGSDEG